MKLVDKEQFSLLSKTFRYTLKDRRKSISLIMVMLLPLVVFAWRFVPNNGPFFFYNNLSVFVYTFGVNFAIVLMASAWFLSTPRRDFATQIIVTIGLFFGIFTTWDTLPFEDAPPMWVDMVISFILFAVVCIYLYYVYRNYINKTIDYKQLHDGIVHDLHHQRFLNSISRIEGLMSVAEMEEPYKSMCEDEITELKESVAYVADKYKELY
uniref:Uncharacterized protein n=1 Tax=Roseihalotalea indica TaxID=2867963 RepID=A0AA49GMY7_9BACT|nr:hypothetical protein K4G66_30710 [Tunicatimonas sp. TK19036]